ncbi:MAG TPA: hypothetical protein PKC13_25610, partial [Blastocatellia bacterium]|nr:hypothetical protein [Blastocatellia bacterium]
MKQKFAIPVSLLCVLVLVELGTTTFAQRRVAYGNRLTGTYTLDVGRSDDAQRVANQATRDLNSQEADRVRNALLRRLDAPQRIALDQSGRRITIISSSAPQVT